MCLDLNGTQDTQTKKHQSEIRIAIHDHKQYIYMRLAYEVYVLPN